MKKRIISSLTSLLFVAFFAVSAQAQIYVYNETDCDLTVRAQQGDNCDVCGVTQIVTIPAGDNMVLNSNCVSGTPQDWIRIRYSTGFGSGVTYFDPTCGTDIPHECNGQLIQYQFATNNQGMAKIRFTN